MKVFDVWVVAAAILAIGDEFEREMHYTTLTERVVATKLTHLGCKGKTPAQSLGKILRENKGAFAKCGSGIYRLKYPNELIKHPDVAQAIVALSTMQTNTTKEGELIALHQEVRMLRERSAVLATKLADIAKICAMPQPN